MTLKSSELTPQQSEISAVVPVGSPMMPIIMHASDQLLKLKERLAAKQAAASALHTSVPNQEHALPLFDLMSSADSISSSASRQEAKEKLRQLEEKMVAIQQQQRVPSSAVNVVQHTSLSQSRNPSPLGLRPASIDIPSDSMSSPAMPKVKMQDLLSQVWPSCAAIWCSVQSSTYRIQLFSKIHRFKSCGRRSRTNWSRPS